MVLGTAHIEVLYSTRLGAGRAPPHVRQVSTDGVNFNTVSGRSSSGAFAQAVLHSSSPNLLTHGWWPSVKKVGLFGGDYPLALSYSDEHPVGQVRAVTAVTVTGSPHAKP